MLYYAKCALKCKLEEPGYFYLFSFFSPYFFYANPLLNISMQRPEVSGKHQGDSYQTTQITHSGSFTAPWAAGKGAYCKNIV